MWLHKYYCNLYFIVQVLECTGIFHCLSFPFTGAYWCYKQYYELKNQDVTAKWGFDEAFALNFSYYLQLKETWLAFGKYNFQIYTGNIKADIELSSLKYIYLSSIQCIFFYCGNNQIFFNTCVFHFKIRPSHR